ncbi:MAG: dGTP triphosphohydrolase, partial [Bacteroidales bacterium]
MDWHSLLSARRFGQSSGQKSFSGEVRTEFQRDYDRIIFSSPFRRLQNKTQVFPLPGSVFVHNRLTHSLEVASVGRSLGNMVFDRITPYLDKHEQEIVREIDAVIGTACLAHDLGNPPFGHSGEKAISHYFSQGKGKEIQGELSELEYADLKNFEGNANLIRLLTNQFKGRRKGGYVLTFASLGAMIKYPYDSSHAETTKKFGFFQSEAGTFQQIVNTLEIPVEDTSSGKYVRHPLVYLVEAADDICYQIMDIEDACKLNILSFEKVYQTYMAFFSESTDKNQIAKIEATLKEVTDRNEQIAFLRAMTINKLVSAVASVFYEHYHDIMQGTFDSKLLKQTSPYIQNAYKQASAIAFGEIYRHPSVVKIEISGYNVLGFLLDEFFQAIMHSGSDYSQKILSLMPAQFHP